jgi:hypothetical protein
MENKFAKNISWSMVDGISCWSSLMAYPVGTGLGKDHIPLTKNPASPADRQTKGHDLKHQTRFLSI